MLKVLIFLMFFILTVEAKHLHTERYYQNRLCKSLDGTMEVVLKDKTRIDCLTKKYAIEVDFAHKWAEGIGQALYYGYMTQRKPAVALIINPKKDQHHIKRLYLMSAIYRIKIFLIRE